MRTPDYIEFEIQDESKFKDCKLLFEEFKLSRASQFNDDKDPQPNSYWLNLFPEYSLKQYLFSDGDLKPNFKIENSKDSAWHFYSMIENIEENIEVELNKIYKTKENTLIGKLEFTPYSFPYGGFEGLCMFLKTFSCKAIKIVENGNSVDVYNVNWLTDYSYELIKDTLFNKILAYFKKK